MLSSDMREAAAACSFLSLSITSLCFYLSLTSLSTFRCSSFSCLRFSTFT